MLLSLYAAKSAARPEAYSTVRGSEGQRVSNSKICTPKNGHVGNINSIRPGPHQIGRKMSRPNLSAVFRQFSKDLFRVNYGSLIKLRVWTPKRHTWFKLNALEPSSYVAPNGASMRPNSPYQQSLVSWRFRGYETIVFLVPKELNARMTRFFRDNAKVLTREQ
ncbi:hypothetical protein TOPH_08075 [Tolypocladium ophioglossoides CBS 100239]|uniref:Tse2 ADP-ribosyltransferase toxin domain-containing protein n=1 Tax=Tolypocladium ophioglossoides (strain CBS 100239) TaxID=1163406 RepID=A0A0L0MZT8_TOLOC|nr:hypothetical protein TOPH_08075 [Tolypocladium ophioglossoides CBS 100239]